MKDKTELKNQVPNGTDGNLIPFGNSNVNNLTCPLDCKHNFFIPTNGKGIIDHNEKYTGWQYCTLFQKRLERTTGGSDVVYQIERCPLPSGQKLYNEQMISELSAKIEKLQDELFELKLERENLL